MRGRNRKVENCAQQSWHFGLLSCESDTLSCGSGMRKQRCENCEGKVSDNSAYTQIFFMYIICMSYVVFAVLFGYDAEAHNAASCRSERCSLYNGRFVDVDGIGYGRGQSFADRYSVAHE